MENIAIDFGEGEEIPGGDAMFELFTRAYCARESLVLQLEVRGWGRKVWTYLHTHLPHSHVHLVGWILLIRYVWCHAHLPHPPCLAYLFRMYSCSKPPHTLL